MGYDPCHACVGSRSNIYTALTTCHLTIPPKAISSSPKLLAPNGDGVPRYPRLVQFSPFFRHNVEGVPPKDPERDLRQLLFGRKLCHLVILTEFADEWAVRNRSWRRKEESLINATLRKSSQDIPKGILKELARSHTTKYLA